MNHLPKRLLSLILALVMVFSLVPAASAYTGVSGWAEAEVAEMDQLGLIPESLQDADLSQEITRLDMARTAVLAYEKVTGQTLEVPAEHPFNDTTDPDAEKAYAAGIVKGDGNGTFRPDDSLTRVEFFCFVGQYLEAVGFQASEDDYSDLSSFADADSIPSWALEQTRLTVGLGIVKGDGSNLDPKDTTSCQEALLMFCRAYHVADDALNGEAPEETVPEETVPEETVPEETVPEEPQPDDNGFINLAGWAEESVLMLDELGLIPEDVRNQPMNEPITRLNMCKLIMNAYKQLMFVSDADLGTPPDPFSDTHDLDVRQAYRLGIVDGDGKGHFFPESNITRQDFCKISVNFLNAINYLYSDDTSVDLTVYSDADQVASYAVGPTRLLISIGAVKGSTSNKLMPRSSISAQEALVIFARIHNFVTTWTASDAEDTRTEISRDTAESLVEFAKQFLGYDYVYGGKSPETGFDCSGFVYYVYKEFGYDLKPSALNQWNVLPDSTLVDRTELLPGDLVFFSDNGQPSGMTHIAIYIGNGQMIHAANSRDGVKISDLNQPYYVRLYLGAKRVIE